MERSPESRDRILEALLDDPRTKPELVDQLSVSRSTVDRRLADLLEERYVEPVGSSYRLTEVGRLALQERLDHRSHMETLDRATPILEAVSPGSVDMQFLRGATVDRPEPQAPWKAFETSMTIVHEANSLAGTAPAVFPQFFDDLSGSVSNGGLECELVVDETLYESFDENELEATREIVEADGGTLLRASLSDAYAIWIADGDEGAHAGLTVYDTGGVQGVIHTDDPEAVAWAREQYRERRAGADVVWDFD